MLARQHFLEGDKVGGNSSQQALFLKVGSTGIGLSQGEIKIVGARQTGRTMIRAREGTLLVGIGRDDRE